MAILKTYTLPNGRQASYHRIMVDMVPSATSQQQIRHQAWINQSDRQSGNAPLWDSTIQPMRTVTGSRVNPETGQSEAFASQEQIDLLAQNVPANASNIRDAIAKAAYGIVKQHYAALQNGDDV